MDGKRILPALSASALINTGAWAQADALWCIDCGTGAKPTPVSSTGIED